MEARRGVARGGEILCRACGAEIGQDRGDRLGRGGIEVMG